jgi:uncharacterized protein YbjT (DUF2867 family)
MGEERYKLHRNAIDAAKAAGVRHIIYTSLSFCGGAEGSTSVAQVAQAHLLTERYLKDSGLTYTILRMACYSHLWNNFAGFLNLDAPPNVVQEAVMPNDGPDHWADRAELGEATAKVIANWVCVILHARKNWLWADPIVAKLHQQDPKFRWTRALDWRRHHQEVHEAYRQEGQRSRLAC